LDIRKGATPQMELGKKQVLEMVKQVDFGVYLSDGLERVLLPKKQVPTELKVGDEIEVFIYKDSSDRLISTVNTPKLTMGQIALLTVSQAGSLGAFLDWGLEKDLFLPHKEMTAKVKPGEEVLVRLYVDKSERLCASMKIYHQLATDSPYQVGDHVEGRIYEHSHEFGWFVAVDDKYSGLISRKEDFGTHHVGDHIKARVAAVKADGKLDLSLRETIPGQMDKDADVLLEKLQLAGGFLGFTDKSSPDEIKAGFAMSKAAFKRAVGRLMKKGAVELKEDGIYAVSDEGSC